MAKRFNFDEAITTDIKGAASDKMCIRDRNKRAPMIWDSEGTGLTYGPPDMERQENRFADVQTQLADCLLYTSSDNSSAAGNSTASSGGSESTAGSEKVSLTVWGLSLIHIYTAHR